MGDGMVVGLPAKVPRSLPLVTSNNCTDASAGDADIMFKDVKVNVMCCRRPGVTVQTHDRWPLKLYPGGDSEMLA